MSERGILFSAPPMVRAILAGTKTKTRRAVKLPDAPNKLGSWEPTTTGGPGLYLDQQCTVPANMPEQAAIWHTRTGAIVSCPYGVPGERLYVKEATWIWCDKRPDGTTPKGRPKFRYVPVGQHVRYCADQEKPTERIDETPRHGWRYKTGRFMPKWASRLSLEITGVRVERVQEISEADAIAEGVSLPERARTFAWAAGPLRNEYAYLWEKINGKRPGCAWADSPWVWVVEFKRASQ